MPKLLFPLAELEGMRDSLFVQLDRGYEAIEEKVAKGEDTQEYEKYWQDLLSQYETVIGSIRAALVEEGV